MHLRQRISAALACIGTLVPAATSADSDRSPLALFTDAELKQIVSHGPWPVPWKRDVSNRVSGRPEAVEFGTHLFFDTRLSGKGNVSCGTCHVPERNWTDNQTRSIGVSELPRNTPTLMNVRLGRWFGWDGAADSLWAQSIRPILDPRELGASATHVAAVVREDEQLSCRYRKTFGTAPGTDDEKILVDIGKALAAFQETLQSGRTPFDEFRDAIQRGAPLAEGRYSEPARRGLKIFIGRGGCSSCHSGPNFTGDQFHDMGVARADSNGRVEARRDEGVKQLQASSYNLLGSYNDDPVRSTARHTRAVADESVAPTAVKVPSLRNLVLTAPYGHDGELSTLAEIVKNHSALGLHRPSATAATARAPLHLSASEQSDLVVFLESLSTFTNPWRPDDGGRCE
jgi:cytochrome c peroxidase